jgi:mRNA interferase HigB
VKVTTAVLHKPDIGTFETNSNGLAAPADAEKSALVLTKITNLVNILMRVIAKRTLRAFWRTHPDAEQPLKAWYEEAAKADWSKWTDIKEKYRTASALRHNRVVFNVKGNAYRLVVKINYPYRVVYIRFVGTHAEYDRVDVETI